MALGRVVCRMRNNNRSCNRSFVKACAILSALSLLIYFVVHYKTEYILSSHFLEMQKCPACYGVKQCVDFHSQISFKGMDLLTIQFSFLQVKNVFFADYLGNSRAVLKKLAHDSELAEFDKDLCNRTHAKLQCDVGRAMKSLAESADMKSVLKGVSDMTQCPTQRLLGRIASVFKNEDLNALSIQEGMHLVTTLMVNQEPIILQAFPASRGWPFPQYYGACGRLIAEEFVGKLLSEFHFAPWNQRVDLAYQILKIADALTNQDKDFALYWTDLSYDNLAVREDGGVVIIDAENIVVVDRTEIKHAKPDKWDVPAESTFDDCPGNCLGFRVETLCSRVKADHNYYAACRNLLSPYAQVENYPGGLLHDIPSQVLDAWPLEELLRECAKPSAPGKRMETVDQLLASLDRLRMVDVDG